MNKQPCLIDRVSALVLVILVMAIAGYAAEEIIVDASGTARMVSARRPIPSSVELHRTNLTPATTTISITGAKTNIGAYLPAGTMGFTFNIFGSGVLAGASNIASGGIFVGDFYASGTQSARYDGIDPTASFTRYFTSATANPATFTFGSIWGVAP
jgi:hypothetical protein